MKKNLFISAMFAFISIMTGAHSVNVDSLSQTCKVLLDVSRHQGDIDFTQVVSPTVKWLYVKATEGQTYTDPKFVMNTRAAQAVGMKVGAYCFFSEKSSALAQAEHFLEIIQLVDLDLIPVLDVEVRQEYTPKQLCDSMQVFLDCVEEAIGCKPMIYASETFYKHFLHDAFGESGYPLWIAKYSGVPDVKADVTLWQSSNQGIVNGITTAVDVSVFMNDHRPRDIKMPDKRKSSGSGKKKSSKGGKKSSRDNKKSPSVTRHEKRGQVKMSSDNQQLFSI